MIFHEQKHEMTEKSQEYVSTIYLKNVLLFIEETTLDMTAINAYKEHESNLIACGNKEKVLRFRAFRNSLCFKNII